MYSDIKSLRTISRSHEGGSSGGHGFYRAKDLIRSLRKELSPIKGNLKAKIAKSMDLYTFTAKTERPLLLQSHKRKSRTLRIEGLDTECPFSQHHLFLRLSKTSC